MSNEKAYGGYLLYETYGWQTAAGAQIITGGLTDADFQAPGGIAVDGNGNHFVQTPPDTMTVKIDLCPTQSAVFSVDVWDGLDPSVVSQEKLNAGVALPAGAHYREVFSVSPQSYINVRCASANVVVQRLSIVGVRAEHS